MYPSSYFGLKNGHVVVSRNVTAQRGSVLTMHGVVVWTPHPHAPEVKLDEMRLELSEIVWSNYDGIPE